MLAPSPCWAVRLFDLMQYHSLTDHQVKASFSDALLASLAPDGGLWMPDGIPHFGPEEAARMGALDFPDCAAALGERFVDDCFTIADVLEICRGAYDFEIPMRTLGGVRLDQAAPGAADDYVLELFHGPTFAFKDFAARFMGRAVSQIVSQKGAARTILVATSGDTGGAIGDAFLDQEGIRVLILFPKGGVSRVQEQQLCTIGDRDSNVLAISVDGTFDDCQQLVKDAFADQELSAEHALMSANSINVGRVIPQSFYYFWTSLAAKAAHPDRPIVYSIPSGNLGNLTGGLIAKRMGAPIDHFVIGHNQNDPMVDYLISGEYRPRASVPTLSNAMDIGRPNNFARILDLFGHDHDAVKAVCWGASFTDDETEHHMRKVYRESGYIMCPHTAVGHMAMEAFSQLAPADSVKITVSTAHPAKFSDSVERIIGESIPMPKALASAMGQEKRVHVIQPTLAALRDYLGQLAP